MPTRVKKNVAGYVDEQGRFRPIRSPQYVGSRKATAKDRKKYSPAKAGDLGKAKQERALEAPWDTEIRLEKEAAERKKRDQDRIMREIEGEAFGTGESRNKGYTLLQFVRAAGGVRRTFRHGGKKGVGKYGKRSSWDSGEIDRLSFKETGRRGLTTDDQRRGKTMDKMFQAARESGYDVTSIDDMMERIESEAANGSPTYATHGSLAYNPGRSKTFDLFVNGKKVAELMVSSRAAAAKQAADWQRNYDAGPGKGKYKVTIRVHNPKAKVVRNPGEVDWKMRVCANCDKYTPNADIKKLGQINVCKACHKKLTASKAAKSQRSLFDDQGSLFNPKKNPGMAWQKYGHKWFLTYRGETLAIVTQDNANSYSVEGERGSSRTLTLAKQKALRVGKAALKTVKAQLMTEAEMISVVNRYGSKTILKKHGKAVGVRAAGGFDNDKWKVRFADGTGIETRIPKRNPSKLKKNPDGITMFAQLASGVASALQVREMLNRKPAAKKRKTTRRKNPAALKTQRTQKTLQTRIANPRKQVTVPAKGDYYLLTIGSGDDIMAVYLQDGDKDGFSKRFKTVAAAKSYATKKRLRLKSESGGRRSNPRTIKATPAIIKALKANPTSDRPPVRTAAKKAVAKANPERCLKCRKMESEGVISANGGLCRNCDAKMRPSPHTRAARSRRVAKAQKHKANPTMKTNSARSYARGTTNVRPLTVRDREQLKAIYAVAVRRSNDTGKKETGIREIERFLDDGHPTFNRAVRAALARFRKTYKVKKNPATTVRRPTFEKFQGRRATTVKALEVSRHAPKRLDQLGDLVGFKLMDENRERVVNPARVKLCASHGRLWIAGQRFAKPDASLGERQLNPIGHIDYVVYKTHKPHHGDPPGQHYIHQLGEEGGTLPLLTVDREGFPVLKGGQYKIQAEGIRD